MVPSSTHVTDEWKLVERQRYYSELEYHPLLTYAHVVWCATTIIVSAVRQPSRLLRLQRSRVLSRRARRCLDRATARRVVRRPRRRPGSARAARAARRRREELYSRGAPTRSHCARSRHEIARSWSTPRRGGGGGRGGGGRRGGCSGAAAATAAPRRRPGGGGGAGRAAVRGGDGSGS